MSRLKMTCGPAFSKTRTKVQACAGPLDCEDAPATSMETVVSADAEDFVYQPYCYKNCSLERTCFQIFQKIKTVPNGKVKIIKSESFRKSKKQFAQIRFFDVFCVSTFFDVLRFFEVCLYVFEWVIFESLFIYFAFNVSSCFVI